MKTSFSITSVLLLCALSIPMRAAGQLPATPADDIGWDTIYHESFDSPYSAADGQTFGADGWLIYQLLNGGAITVANGYAQLDASDFQNAALIRSTQILPDEYKLRTKIGYINYDLTNYEQADFDHPDFNTHGGKYENGMYFLTVTDDTCVGNQCAENWWHYHRKMVIDVDSHIDSRADTIHHPTYLVYMAPETNQGGNLLRTWTGSYWDTSPWNWNSAYTYDYDSWYYAELEKRNDQIILRLYDSNQSLIEETTPVDLSLVHAMDDPREYLYLGEPHTDDYEGDVRIDEITLLVPSVACCDGLIGNVLLDIETNCADVADQTVDVIDLTSLIDHLFINFTPFCCLDETDLAPLIDGDPADGVVDVVDLTALIDHLFINFHPMPECP